MKTQRLLLLFLLLLLATGCRPAERALAGAAPQTEKGAGVPADCPVTLPGDPDFSPPEPWSAIYPYEGSAWYGTEDLWTALPVEGTWPQLALGEKSWWWSEHFNVKVEPVPALIVTARRLDGKAPEFQSGAATNGYHPDFHWAMLTGVELPTTGCWEIMGTYGKASLSYVVWVP